MRVLVYPCFLSCTEYTEDEYWKNIFEDLAFAITPQGAYISKHYIISNTKNKEFVYKINIDLDPETIFIDIYNLFSEKLGIKSVQEIEDYKNSIDSSELVFNSWNSIKKKSIRDSIILDYVTKKSEEYNLSRARAKELLNTINLGILLKFISNKHIHYDDNEIKDIEGFEFKQDGFVFTQTTEYSSNTLEYNKYKISLVDVWIKFVEMLTKSVFQI
jgi:hypothetical protein